MAHPRLLIDPRERERLLDPLGIVRRYDFYARAKLLQPNVGFLFSYFNYRWPSAKIK